MTDPPKMPGAAPTLESSSKKRLLSPPGAMAMPHASAAMFLHHGARLPPQHVGSANAELMPPKKKRPYRRTKRPKDYCDKSTVTAASPTVATPVNVYDAVLGEAQDLWLAAQEAQSLGRLKLAGTYLLLLHARLVGLGNRFDRSTIVRSASSSAAGGKKAGTPRTLDMVAEEEDETPAVGDQEAKEPKTDSSKKVDGRIAAAVEPPSQYKNHLSVAFANTANAEWKPKTPYDAPPVPLTPVPNLSSTHANKNNVANTAGSTSSILPPPLQQLTQMLPSNLELDTAMMEHLARAAVELHHQRTNTGHHANAMAEAMASISAEKPDKATSASENTTNKNSKPAAAGDAKKPSPKDRLDPKVKKDPDEENDDDEDENVTPRRKGGRGRKPPTAAMNTVPNANLNARALIRPLVVSKEEEAKEKATV